MRRFLEEFFWGFMGGFFDPNLPIRRYRCL